MRPMVWVMALLALTVVAGIFAFAGVMYAMAWVAKALFYILLILFVMSLIWKFTRQAR